MTFFADNAGCLSGAPFPRNGYIIVFGDIEVYVATTRIRAFPDNFTSWLIHLLTLQLAAGVPLAPLAARS